MPEIPNCQLCGSEPVIYPTWDHSEPAPEATECCGAAFTTVDAWNKYAAAMELAKATFEYENSNKSTVAKNGARLTEAYDKVLGVFK